MSQYYTEKESPYTFSLNKGSQKNREELIKGGFLPRFFPWKDPKKALLRRDIYAIAFYWHWENISLDYFSSDLAFDAFIMEKSDEDTFGRMLTELDIYIPEDGVCLDKEADVPFVFDFFLKLRTRGKWGEGKYVESKRETLIDANTLLAHMHLIMFGTIYNDEGYLISLSEFQAVVDTGKLTGEVPTEREPFSVSFHDLGFSSLKPGLADVLVESIIQSDIFVQEHILDIRMFGLNSIEKNVFTRCWMVLLGSSAKRILNEHNQLNILKEGQEKTREFIMTLLQIRSIIDPTRKTLNEERLKEVVKNELGAKII